MITKQWHKRNGDLDYFVAQVKATPITITELDDWMTRNGDTCPVCVNKVFAHILYEAVSDGTYPFPNKKGGEL
ncbi:MAG: hypothetical protein NC248_11350 [Bacteroides sp.]|nr:hypothetical protein [Bacteroides sp.]MCM1391053.1 hypothetical protein [Bacteroides sp.]